MKVKSSYKFVRIGVFVLSLTVIAVESAAAQDVVPSDSVSRTPSLFTRRNLITYGIVAHSIFTTYVEYKWWWKGDYHPFTFEVEGFVNDYSVGVDKLGHMYTSHFYFHTLHDLLRWGGYEESTSLWVSAIIPFVYAFSIELGDGFSSFHFSPDDLAFNTMGIVYGVLQEEYPLLKNFKYKWSYFPSASHLNSFVHPFSADYDSHIYWITFNVHNLLPERISHYWPRFLNLAVGYGGQNISIGDEGPKLRKFAIGFDYDLTSIPLDGDTWDLIKNLVDNFHFPAPGVRIIQNEPAKFKPLLLN